MGAGGGAAAECAAGGGSRAHAPPSYTCSCIRDAASGWLGPPGSFSMSPAPQCLLPDLFLEQTGTATAFPFTPHVLWHQFYSWTQIPAHLSSLIFHLGSPWDQQVMLSGNPCPAPQTMFQVSAPQNSLPKWFHAHFQGLHGPFSQVGSQDRYATSLGGWPQKSNLEV